MGWKEAKWCSSLVFIKEKIYAQIFQQYLPLIRSIAPVFGAAKSLYNFRIFFLIYKYPNIITQIHCRAFMFELWCERSRLLGPMDMSEAIASYLHLAFTFNLKYSKEVFVIFARDHMWSYFYRVHRLSQISCRDVWLNMVMSQVN